MNDGYINKPKFRKGDYVRNNIGDTYKILRVYKFSYRLRLIHQEITTLYPVPYRVGNESSEHIVYIDFYYTKISKLKGMLYESNL